MSRPERKASRFRQLRAHLAPRVMTVGIRLSELQAWPQQTLVDMDPSLSRHSGRTFEELLELRLRSLDERGFVVIDDLEEHPLLGRLEAAARAMREVADAKVPISLDSSLGYVHRTSALRGESKSPSWTGGRHMFKREEAWALRGGLHPAWEAVLPDQAVFGEFLCSYFSLEWLRRWTKGELTPGRIALPDVTFFVNPREADFSEGWHRDTTWHGGNTKNQQDLGGSEDWSAEGEQRRWRELQAQNAAQRERGLSKDGVNLFIALVDDPVGCHELVPESHREFRTEHQYAVLRKLNGVGHHPPLPGAVSIRLKRGQALIRSGLTIHRGNTRADCERLTMVTGFSRRLAHAGVEDGNEPAAPAAPAKVIDVRQRWKLSSQVREALPTPWLREAYDQWRVGFKDGGRLIDRLNANERERLSPQERERAERPLSSLKPVS